MIVIYVHNQDTVDMLKKEGIERADDFDWYIGSPEGSAEARMRADAAIIQHGEPIDIPQVVDCRRY